MGGFGRVINGLSLKKPIVILNPYNKISITYIQPNPIILGKIQSTHLPNNFMYLYG